MKRSRLALCVALIALGLCGCGLGPGSVPSGVRLTVSSDFGASSLMSVSLAKVPGGETVMGLLARESHLTTRGPAKVQSINGTSAGPNEEWSYYVNGVQGAKNPSKTAVHPGDHIWWDLHQAAAMTAPAVVVGSFPEPFLNGLQGQRLPVRVECVSVGSAPCTTVTATLRKLGVPAAIAGIGVTEGLDTLRVLVGPFSKLQSDPGAQSIQRGPQISGVYAQFSGAGRTLTLLNEHLDAPRALSGAAGLIAADRYFNESPEWLVTGTDEAGVELAAKDFNEASLHEHFALAVSGTEAIALPLRGQ